MLNRVEALIRCYMTGGLLGLGFLFDLWTLNDQISQVNQR
jgi:hypothetical protein